MSRSTLPASLAGRFLEVCLLGSGGFGSVFRVRDRDLDREVALKILHPAAAGQEEWLARFLREGRIGARLASPHLVRIFDLGLAEGVPWLALELVAGPSLAGRIAAQRGPVEPGEAVRILDGILAGLEVAHDAGIVHRDLKTENVLLREDGSPVIVDFGLARELGVAGPTRSGQIMGTLGSMAPEQFSGGEPKPGWDLYAVGVIGFELLVGREPFGGLDLDGLVAAKAKGTRAGLRGEGALVSSELDRLVRRMLAPHPADRPGSAREARTALAGTPEAQGRTAVRADVTLGGPLPGSQDLARTVVREPAGGTLVLPVAVRPRVRFALVGLVVLALLVAGLGRARQEAVADPRLRAGDPVRRARSLLDRIQADRTIGAALRLSYPIDPGLARGLANAGRTALERFRADLDLAAREAEAAAPDEALVALAAELALVEALLGPESWAPWPAGPGPAPTLAPFLARTYRLETFAALGGRAGATRVPGPGWVRRFPPPEAGGGAGRAGILRPSSYEGVPFRAGETDFVGVAAGELIADVGAQLASSYGTVQPTATLEVPLGPVAGSLELGISVFAFAGDIPCRLRIRGTGSEARLAIAVPGGAIRAAGIDAERLGYRLRVAPELVPAGPVSLVFEARGIQPISQLRPWVGIEAVWQAGPGS